MKYTSFRTFRFYFSFVCAFLFTFCGYVAKAADFPTKPIKIIVYTNPGGLIDITARKFAGVLESEAKKSGMNQPVVVENKKGAGGLVALHYLSRQPADGHTLLALTSSVISKAVQSRQEKKLDDVSFLARLVDDYECLIVNRESSLKSFADLKADAQKKAGGQIWLGPAAGGTDHIFAKKFWKATGLSGKWVPYKSGSDALAALLGGHGDVYVGNPQDVRGRPDLKVLAVASPERLPDFSEAPTFAELNLPTLTGESLWRGIVVASATPGEVKEELLALLKKASESGEWQKFVTSGSAIPVFETEGEFKRVVDSQIQQEKNM